MSVHLAVLVVDDERISRATTVRQLRQAGYRAEEAPDGASALRLLSSERWDVLLTDLRMPEMDGLALLRAAKECDGGIEVLLMTAFGSVETAVEAMRAGAFDYLTKPFRFGELELRLRRLKEARETRAELGRLRAIVGSSGAADGIVGECAAMRRLRTRIEVFAASAAPALVVGETGTGKELVARAIHAHGPRRDEPFVAVAAGAIPTDLAESQLFGHERGSFTGASQRRRGYFELADKGTLLIDDVDDLPPELQVKLLRVLQEGTVRRVGGEAEFRVDVRTIATTKVDLAGLVEQGKFRSDLYYRLRGLELHIPPLRAREGDLLLLVQHFAQLSGTGRSAVTLSPSALGALSRHTWPGNVRELRRVLEAAVALAGDGVVDLEHLPDALVSPRAQSPLSLRWDGVQSVLLPALVEELEDAALRWALDRSEGQQQRAADMLGIPRTTLQSKLRGRRPI